MMCPLLIVGRKHVEFRHMRQAREDAMENRLKRKLADDALTASASTGRGRISNA
jgi:hypothetical protein